MCVCKGLRFFRTAKIMILNNYPNIIIDRIAAAICFSKNSPFFTNGLLKLPTGGAPARWCFDGLNKPAEPPAMQNIQEYRPLPVFT